MTALHPGMTRLNELEAMAAREMDWYAPATRSRYDGSETIEASADAIVAFQAAADLRRLVNHIKSDPDLLTRVVRVLAK